MQKVEYENLLVICFNCGIYGHKNKNCPRLNTMTRQTKNLENNGIGNSPSNSGDQPSSSTITSANPSFEP